MYAGPWRHARSLTVGAVCVALSLAGHLAGGGRAPDLRHALVAVLAVVVITALVCLAVGWASRCRWTFGRAVLSLGLGQAVLHAAFTLVLLPAGHPGGPASSAMPDMAGMAGRSGMAGTAAMAGTAGMPSGISVWWSGPAVSMAAGHVGAALAAAVLIARTDSALGMWFTVSAARTLARSAVRRVVRALDAAAWSAEEHQDPTLRPTLDRGSWLLRAAPHQRVDGRGLSRRGPPRPA
jgi:hypothetical protein